MFGVVETENLRHNEALEWSSRHGFGAPELRVQPQNWRSFAIPSTWSPGKMDAVWNCIISRKHNMVAQAVARYNLDIVCLTDMEGHWNIMLAFQRSLVFCTAANHGIWSTSPLFSHNATTGLLWRTSTDRSSITRRWAKQKIRIRTRHCRCKITLISGVYSKPMVVTARSAGGKVIFIYTPKQPAHVSWSLQLPPLVGSTL